MWNALMGRRYTCQSTVRKVDVERGSQNVLALPKLGPYALGPNELSIQVPLPAATDELTRDVTPQTAIQTDIVLLLLVYLILLSTYGRTSILWQASSLQILPPLS